MNEGSNRGSRLPEDLDPRRGGTVKINVHPHRSPLGATSFVSIGLIRMQEADLPFQKRPDHGLKMNDSICGIERAGRASPGV